MGIKQLFKHLIWGPRATSETYVKYLRSLGMAIGDDVCIYVPTKTTIDEQYPWMIEIGNHVKIAQGSVLLTHDYSWSVLKAARGGAILGSSGKIKIGNCVFIGMNSIVTCGVTIGDNVIIGAGSVVTKDCIEPGVYVGAPAQRIMDLETFYQKRMAAQLREAKALFSGYFERYKKIPTEEVFHEYFMLFTDAETASKKTYCIEKMKLMGNDMESLTYIRNNAPHFAGYEEFVAYCLENMSEGPHTENLR